MSMRLIIKNAEKLFRNFFPKRLKKYRNIINLLKNKKGIEIGGPSFAFSKRGFIPIYQIINSLDGCNFSNDTIWEGKISEGLNFKFDDREGWQYIKDAVCLEGIESEKYDFILSCHSLEHIANPIKAIEEWKRVLKTSGYILIIVPHKEKTFDRKRTVTTIEHIIEDYKKEITEDDQTHFQDVILNHDFSIDPGILNQAEFIKRTKNNQLNRCLHHHVFNTKLLVELIQFCKLKIIEVDHFSPFHIVLLAQKTNMHFSNENWLDANSSIYSNSLFQSDKK